MNRTPKRRWLRFSLRTMLVVVTHSLELAGLFQRRLELDDGRLGETDNGRKDGTRE